MTSGFHRASRNHLESEPWLPATATLKTRGQVRPCDFAVKTHWAHLWSRVSLCELVADARHKRSIQKAKAQMHEHRTHCDTALLNIKAMYAATASSWRVESHGYLKYADLWRL